MTEQDDSFYGVHPKQIVPGTLFVSRDPINVVNLLVLGNVRWSCHTKAGYDWTGGLNTKIHWNVFFLGLHGETGEKLRFCVEGAQNNAYDEIVWYDYYVLLPTSNEEENRGNHR